MKILKCTDQSKNLFVIGLLLQTLIFVIFLLTNSYLLFTIGCWFLFILVISNLFFLLDEIIQIFKNKNNGKVHVRSVLLLCSNFLIGIIYYLILILFN